jgi:hypothetical protein
MKVPWVRILHLPPWAGGEVGGSRWAVNPISSELGGSNPFLPTMTLWQSDNATVRKTGKTGLTPVRVSTGSCSSGLRGVSTKHLGIKAPKVRILYYPPFISGCSSIGTECLASNEKVAGSSPVIRTIQG